MSLQSLLDDLRAILPLAELKISGFARDRDNTPQKGLVATDLDVMDAAVAVLVNDTDYEEWIRIGEAMHAAYAVDPERGRAAFTNFCLRWTRASSKGLDAGDDADRAWDTFQTPHSVGVDYLLGLASAGSGRDFKAEMFLADESVVPETPEEIAARVAAEEAKAQAKANRYRLETLSELAANANRRVAPYLVKGLLDFDALAVMYGDSNCGKTFVGMDLAYAVASGHPWCGMKTAKAAVVYVAAEGGSGYTKRAAALRKKYGEEDVPFYVIRSALDLYQQQGDDMAGLIDAVKGLLRKRIKVGMIVLDTLARVMAGGDENSTKDMGIFVSNTDNLRRACSGAGVLLIHHTGKDASKGARGSSALRAATATEIEVAPGSFKVKKQRDMETEFETGFRLKAIDLGKDEEGDAVVSCVIETDGQKPKDRIRDLDDIVFRKLRDLTAEGGGKEGFKLVRIIELAKDDQPKISRADVENSLRRLIKSQNVMRSGYGLYALNLTDSAEKSP